MKTLSLWINIILVSTKTITHYGPLASFVSFEQKKCESVASSSLFKPSETQCNSFNVRKGVPPLLNPCLKRDANLKQFSRVHMFYFLILFEALKLAPNHKLFTPQHPLLTLHTFNSWCDTHAAHNYFCCECTRFKNFHPAVAEREIKGRGVRGANNPGICSTLERARQTTSNYI